MIRGLNKAYSLQYTRWRGMTGFHKAYDTEERRLEKTTFKVFTLELLIVPWRIEKNVNNEEITMGIIVVVSGKQNLIVDMGIF